ncbi:SBBP repeat-containing protein [Hymenobacter sp. NST-14]|uniref:SBBP repeat-containing protein n=1 Tax=Hymenobacter piscis TaxID=2839984 RepID=UPI001C013BA5|nr:SBBP repeat-containing protein [Hymenobacter piscis]MBT9392778.1 SBBP repeat-containing protein [Hymenobacter piscis]
MNTLTLPRRLTAALSGLLLTAAAATAQTAPPAWTSARAVGSGSSAVGNAAVDAAGNLYEAGTFSGSTTVGGTTLTSQGSTDGFLAKYASDGTVLWVRQLASPGADYAYAVALDAAGNAYLTGYFTGSVDLGNNLKLEGGTTTGRKLYCIRYSSQGQPEWVQQSTSANNNESARGTGIALDAAGHVYVTGLLTRALTIGPTTIGEPTGLLSLQAGYVARFTAATGALEALTTAFTYPVPTTGSLSYFNPLITASPTGQVYVLNRFEQSLLLPTTTPLTSTGDTDVAVLRYAPDGTLQWARQFGSPARDEVSQTATDTAGNLYVAGLSFGSVTAGSVTLPNAGSADGLLLKYDATGTVEWARPLGGPGFDKLSGLTLDAAGAPYVTGYFEQRVTMGTQTLTSAGGVDVLVAAYSPQGQFRWVQQAGGPGNDNGYYLGAAANGDLFVTGSFAWAATFGSLALTTTRSSETFVARLGNAMLGTGSARPLALHLAPNPARGQVHLSGLPTGHPVQILDGLGRLVRTPHLPPDAILSLQDLTPGLYLLRALDAQNQPYAGRLVVE